VRANREAPALSTGCLLKHLIHPFFFGFYMSGEHRHLHFLLCLRAGPRLVPQLIFAKPPILGASVPRVVLLLPTGLQEAALACQSPGIARERNPQKHDNRTSLPDLSRFSTRSALKTWRTKKPPCGGPSSL
jgi:hypothetical protein